MKKLYNFIFGDSFKKKLETLILKVSLFSFVIHLLIIALNNIYPLEFLSEVNFLNHPISAIYTPFSFILISEVYLLIYYIPRSFTQSVAKQYEVVALIIIRKIFKDISNINLEIDWFSHDYNTKLTIDMVSVLIIFLLIGLFHTTYNQLNKTDKTEDKEAFIDSKRIIAVVLFFIFVGLSIYHLADWSISIYHYLFGTYDAIHAINPIFYDDFFTVLIIMDVWLLIVSFKYTNNYFSLMRNSGFIVSTILIRIGISGESLASTPLMLLSIAFGWVILLIFKRFFQVSKL